jgi:hypothetical protein
MQSSQDRRPSGTRRLPRRPTDRVEDAAAWVLTAAALLVALWGVLVGIHVRDGVVDRGRAAEQDRTRVEAVLGADAPQVRDRGATALTARTARYTDPAGRQHAVLVAVSGSPPEGSCVPVWLDRDGNAVGAPPSGTDAVVLGVASGIGIVVGGVVLLLGTWAGMRWELDRRNAVGWAEEWARVEPRWSRRRH